MPIQRNLNAHPRAPPFPLLSSAQKLTKALFLTQHINTHSIMSASEQQPWYAAYPKAVSEAVFLPRSTVLEWFSSEDKLPGKHFVLVDLRRNDHEVDLPSLPIDSLIHNE